jgi:signal transduction histidine kinase
VFGNLYLARKASGRSFTAADESIVEALATGAGYVVDNARTYAISERRRLLLEATAQVTEALQPPVRLHEALEQIAVSARRVSGAAAVAVVQRHDDRQEVAAAAGTGVEALPTVVEHLRARIVGAEDQPEVVIVPETDRRTAVLVPLRAHVADNGVLLILLDQGRGRLAAEEIELLVSFADQASLALDRAQALSDRAQLAIVSDRERIARDLHDVVIQRLFATGLHLQGAQRAATGEVAQRLAAAVADLDLTIRDIRSTIFQLKNAHRLSVRADVNVLAGEYAPVLGFAPVVRTAGPVDTAVPGELGEQLSAVLREALSNVAQHARASAVLVEIEVDRGELLLRVTDDGRGMPAETHESGLRNVRTRAREHGGVVRIRPGEPTGTVLEWLVPLGR